MCHAVLGKPLGRKALLLGATLGVLPDLDILVRYANDLDSVIYHRSFSHSLIVLLGVSVFIAALIHRWQTRENRKRRAPEASYQRILLGVALALMTHPLLDAFTVYGTQLFWPFFTALDGRSPESWSTLFIIDPLYTLPLLIGFVAALIAPNRTRLVTTLVGLSGVYILWSLLAKLVVHWQVEPVIAQQLGKNTQYFSTPTPFNTLLWRVVAIDENYYYTGHYSLMSPSREIVFVKRPRNPELSPLVEPNDLAKLQWFSHGFYKLSQDGPLVIATDLRMGAEGAYAFNFVVHESAESLDDSKTTLPYRLERELDFGRLDQVYDKL